MDAGLALAAVVLLWRNGAGTSPLIGASGLGLAARLDALSVTMMLLVSFIGWVVLRFSATYMDGEDRQGAFTGWLVATLAVAGTVTLPLWALAVVVDAWYASRPYRFSVSNENPTRLPVRPAAGSPSLNTSERDDGDPPQMPALVEPPSSPLLNATRAPLMRLSPRYGWCLRT